MARCSSPEWARTTTVSTHASHTTPRARRAFPIQCRSSWRIHHRSVLSPRRSTSAKLARPWRCIASWRRVRAPQSQQFGGSDAMERHCKRAEWKSQMERSLWITCDAPILGIMNASHPMRSPQLCRRHSWWLKERNRTHPTIWQRLQPNSQWHFRGCLATQEVPTTSKTIPSFTASKVSPSGRHFPWRLRAARRWQSTDCRRERSTSFKCRERIHWAMDWWAHCRRSERKVSLCWECHNCQFPIPSSVYIPQVQTERLVGLVVSSEKRKKGIIRSDFTNNTILLKWIEVNLNQITFLSISRSSHFPPAPYQLDLRCVSPFSYSLFFPQSWSSPLKI